ncbi:MAG: ParB/RepB/Spo0J family partition protein [Clostridia bacterium]|nr:ParB/RepB/Spo0J family partition protein [Clostridia bacterium]
METATKTPKQVGRVMLIPIGEIKTNPNQPRKCFSDKDLQGLAESIRYVGVIQPLTVRKAKDGGYELIAGERRLRAAESVGLKSLPCVEISTNDSGCAVVSLLENMQRQSLNFIEEAVAIYRLLKEYSITQEQAACYLGMAQSTLCNKLRILTLPKSVQEIIIEHRLTERHARALLKLENESDMLYVVKNVAEQKLNVSGTETLINQCLEGCRNESAARRAMPVIKDVRIFQNTITNAVKVMRQAGIMADSMRRETEDYIEYVVKIPKNTNTHK